MRVSRGVQGDGIAVHLKTDDRERANRYVFAGRIERMKGIDILLQAWKQIENTQGEKSPELIVCGMGQNPGHLSCRHNGMRDFR